MSRWSSQKIGELLPRFSAKYPMRQARLRSGPALFCKHPLDVSGNIPSIQTCHSDVRPHCPSLAIPTPNAGEESATAWHARIESRTIPLQLRLPNFLSPAYRVHNIRRPTSAWLRSFSRFVHQAAIYPALGPSRARGKPRNRSMTRCS